MVYSLNSTHQSRGKVYDVIYLPVFSKTFFDLDCNYIQYLNSEILQMCVNHNLLFCDLGLEIRN